MTSTPAPTPITPIKSVPDTVVIVQETVNYRVDSVTAQQYPQINQHILVG
jgi:hypothetical protein